MPKDIEAATNPVQKPCRVYRLRIPGSAGPGIVKPRRLKQDANSSHLTLFSLTCMGVDGEAAGAAGELAVECSC